MEELESFFNHYDALATWLPSRYILFIFLSYRLAKFHRQTRFVCLNWLRMADRDIRTHEVAFCSRVSKWADSLFESDKTLPFTRTEIEQSKGIRKKRSDLRVFDATGKLVLAGEVKLPGTVEGRNPHSSTLVEDAYLKASNAGAQFFFTWNVNRLVLFDSKRWEVPLPERRVKEYDLKLDLDKPEDVERPEVEEAIKAFLAKFFSDLKAIAEGTKPDWGMVVA